MWGDEVLEGVRAVREAQAARFGFDVRAVVADLRRREAASGHPVVLPPTVLGAAPPPSVRPAGEPVPRAMVS